MSAKANHFKLGLFILGAIAIVVATVLALGAGALFEKKVVMETYFDTSVQGLAVGSAIKYRGVPLGEVSEITFTYTQYEQNEPMSTRKPYVMVKGTVQPELIGMLSDVNQQDLRTNIERGLRVRIAVTGITGTNYLELDFTDPEQNPPLPIDWVPKNVYVPSAPGTVAQITSAVEELARRLQKLDVEALLNNVNQVAVTANSKLEAFPIDRVSGNVETLVTEVRETNRRFQAFLANPNLKAIPRDAAVAAAQVRKLAESEQVQKSIARLSQTIERLDRLVAGHEDEIAETVENFHKMSANLRELSENLEQYPGEILRGEPPRRERR
jgi:ABC-type transporter Mla subunit MlaD